jgi:hypothetical protein
LYLKAKTQQVFSTVHSLIANAANERMTRIFSIFIREIRLFAQHLHCTERSAVQVFAMKICLRFPHVR